MRLIFKHCASNIEKGIWEQIERHPKIENGRKQKYDAKSEKMVAQLLLLHFSSAFQFIILSLHLEVGAHEYGVETFFCLCLDWKLSQVVTFSLSEFLMSPFKIQGENFARKMGWKKNCHDFLPPNNYYSQGKILENLRWEKKTHITQ